MFKRPRWFLVVTKCAVRCPGFAACFCPRFVTDTLIDREKKNLKYLTELEYQDKTDQNPNGTLRYGLPWLPGRREHDVNVNVINLSAADEIFYQSYSVNFRTGKQTPNRIEACGENKYRKYGRPENIVQECPFREIIEFCKIAWTLW